MISSGSSTYATYLTLFIFTCENLPSNFSTKLLILPLRELPGIYGSFVIGFLTTVLSAPPIDIPTLAPPICKPVIASIVPSIKIFLINCPFSIVFSPILLSSKCFVICQYCFKKIRKIFEKFFFIFFVILKYQIIYCFFETNSKFFCSFIFFSRR